MMDGIIPILISLLPGILYAFVIWVTMPYSSFSLKTAYRYVLLGIFSVAFLSYIHTFLPFFFDDDEHMILQTLRKNIPYIRDFSFWQVALPEEISKLITFIFIYKLRKFSDDNPSKDSVIATMVYCAMVSLGFAIIENIQYGLAYGSKTAYLRLFSAVLLHMEVGLMMGYWIALGKLKNKNLDRSIVGILFNVYPKLKYFTFTTIGLSCAVFVHGVYDFNIFVFNNQSTPLMYVILGIGSFICWIGANHLVHLERNEKTPTNGQGLK